jgi:hypothetical protein
MPVVNTTNTFTNNEQITSTKLNDIMDNSSFVSGAVVTSGGLEITVGGQMQIASDGVTTARILNSNVTTAKIADANVTQAKLGTNVVGNGPAFRAYASTMTSIPAVTYTKINLASETFDTNSNFASSRFTPTIAGYYLITGTIFIDSSVMIGFLASIFKNGVTYANGSSQVRANALRATVNDIVYLNGSTDYVELYGYHESSGSFNVGAGIEQTYFSGCLIRSA